MKHSKGPWKIGTYANTNKAYLCDSEGSIFYEETTSDIPANPSLRAHLIAAAPKMLEMLEKLLPDICEYRHFYPDQGDENPHPAISELINLIKKAKGEK